MANGSWSSSAYSVGRSSTGRPVDVSVVRNELVIPPYATPATAATATIRPKRARLVARQGLSSLSSPWRRGIRASSSDIVVAVRARVSVSVQPQSTPSTGKMRKLLQFAAGTMGPRIFSRPER